MPFINFTLSLYLLSFIFLLLQTVFLADSIFHICSTSNNFTKNDPYDTNLAKLMGSLSYKTPPTGFNYSSEGESQNQVFGLALCRGDVSDVDCANCVIEASTKVRHYCSYNKSGIIWYDNCQVKYSDMSFFGKIDNQNMFYAMANQNASDPSSFNPKVRKLLRELAKQAPESPKMFKTRSLKIGEGTTIYGWFNAAETFLEVIDDEIRRQPDCCDGKNGGRVGIGSCNIRYEVSPLVKV